MEFSPRYGFTSEPPNDDREHKGVFPINYLHRHKNGCVFFFHPLTFPFFSYYFLFSFWKFGNLAEIIIAFFLCFLFLRQTFMADLRLFLRCLCGVFLQRGLWPGLNLLNLDIILLLSPCYNPNSACLTVVTVFWELKVKFPHLHLTTEGVRCYFEFH